MNESHAPIKVAVIDAEECLEPITSTRGHAAVWALVRERGRPRGMIRVALEDCRVSRERLVQAIATLPPARNAGPLEAPDGVELPRISVVIPSLMRRRETLDACLRSLAAADYPDYEVIVVDNRPGDVPPVELAGVRVVREPRVGNSAARNRGLAAATGEVVAFTDDDVEVDPDWLLAIGLRFCTHPEEACVTGLLLPRELETPAQVMLEEYYGGLGPRACEPLSYGLRVAGGWRSLLRPATVDAVGDDGATRQSFSLYATGTLGTGPNMAFRTDTLRELGGFDPALGAGTPARGGGDLMTLARVLWRGHRIGFEPAALVHHNHYVEWDSLQRQIESYGFGWSALLFALAVDDPRHLARMLATAPRAGRVLTARYRHKLDPGHADPLERSLARKELRAIAAGPAAYLRSRRAQRRWAA